MATKRKSNVKIKKPHGSQSSPLFLPFYFALIHLAKVVMSLSLVNCRLSAITHFFCIPVLSAFKCSDHLTKGFGLKVQVQLQFRMLFMTFIDCLLSASRLLHPAS